MFHSVLTFQAGTFTQATPRTALPKEPHQYNKEGILFQYHPSSPGHKNAFFWNKTLLVCSSVTLWLVCLTQQEIAEKDMCLYTVHTGKYVLGLRETR